MKEYVCNTCRQIKIQDKMSRCKLRGGIKYYYCKGCVNNKKKLYRANKKRLRGSNTIRGRPKKKFKMIIGASTHENITVDDIVKITGINKQLVWHIINRRIKKYSHIFIKSI